MSECLLCGKATKMVDESFRGYQEPDTFQILYCDTCNTQFSYPRVNADKVYENIYRQVDKVAGYDRYHRYSLEVKQQKNPLDYLAAQEEAYWAIRDTLQKEGKPNDVKVAELGSGLGYLTYALNKAGYSATGIEISESAVQRAKDQFGDFYKCADIRDFAKEHQEQYDFVIATEVIEHIEEPVKLLESIMPMLKKSGKILLTTPNKTIFPSDAIWRTDLPPVHIWWFSEKSMEYIASKINAKVSFVDFTDYYKEKPSIVDLNTYMVQDYPRLDSKGDAILVLQEEPKPTPLSGVKNIIKKIPFAVKIK